MKYTRNYLKQVTKGLNEWVKAGDYDRSLLVKQTGFFNIHSAERGLNPTENTVLEFTTRLIACSEVLLVRDPKYSTIELYLKSEVYNYDSAGVYIEIRKDGKTLDCTTLRSQDELGWKLNDIPGLTSKDFEREFSYSEEEIRAKLEAAGYTVLTFFAFTEKLNTGQVDHSGFGPTVEQVKETHKGVELNCKVIATYNTLPMHVEILRSKDLPTVKLASIGLEDKGYHSHDQRCSIPKEQAAQAKAFFKSKGVKL